MITRVLRDINNEKTIARVRSEAKALCDQFPLYPDMV
jgi:glycine/serine hydroxymethyltransferase